MDRFYATTYRISMQEDYLICLQPFGFSPLFSSVVGTKSIIVLWVYINFHSSDILTLRSAKH